MRRKEKGRFMQPRFSEAIRSLKSMQSSKYARPDAVTSHIVKKRPAELSLDRLGKMPASPAPDTQPLCGRSTQFLFHLGLLDEESARKGKRQPSHSLLPNIRKYEADLPEGSFNFEREKIQRTQLSALVQESEEDQRVSRMKKKLKQVASKYRAQVFRISDALNMQVPSNIKQQQQVQRTQSRLMLEILKRSPE